MKKIILAVILLTAAGGITYYLLQKKKTTIISNVDKKLLIGKWKIDSLVQKNSSTKDDLAFLLFAIDSNARNLIYDFQTDGKIFISRPDNSLNKGDTAVFTWGKENKFLWKEKINNPATDTLNVIKLDKKNFIIQSSDSVRIYLAKEN